MRFGFFPCVDDQAVVVGDIEVLESSSGAIANFLTWLTCRHDSAPVLLPLLTRFELDVFSKYMKWENIQGENFLECPSLETIRVYVSDGRSHDEMNLVAKVLNNFVVSGSFRSLSVFEDRRTWHEEGWHHKLREKVGWLKRTVSVRCITVPHRHFPADRMQRMFVFSL